MRPWNRFRSVWKLLFNRNAVESDLDEELSGFYEILVERYIAEGLTRRDALRKARLRFQHPEQAKEEIRTARPGAILLSFLRDVKYAWRGIRKSPVFAFAVVLTLGLGIGANSTIFSIVNRFAFTPPPVRDPATLIALHTIHDGDRCCNNFSWPLYTELRDQAKSFSGVAGYYELVPASLDGSGDPERVWGQAATTNFFDVAQLAMTLGRGFAKDENQSRVVVMGHALWQRRFHSDPDIIGKFVRLSGRPFTVIGVAPSGFRGLDLILDCQFWVPLGKLDELLPNTSNLVSRDFHWIDVIGRLRTGFTRTRAVAELNVLAKRFATVHPNEEKGGGFRVEQAGSLPPRDKGSIEMFFAALSLVALLVLCIACANVANIALARAAGRQHETAVRLALGARRGHLLRQLLTESLLLAFGGGICSVALSFWATRGLGAFRIPAPVPLDLSIAVDWKVLLYTFALSVGAGVICGLAPASMAARRTVANAMKGEDCLGRPGRIWSLRNALVIAQIAVSVVLLCATGLCLHSLENASRIDIGFRSEGVLMSAIDPRLHGYTAQRTVQTLSLLRDEAATIPGVVSAAYTDSVPLSGGFRSDTLTVEGGSEPIAPAHDVDLYMVSSGFFDTIGIPLLAGHDFTHENASSPLTAVVNEAFVQTFFENRHALGRIVSDAGRKYQIIGVVRNIKSRTLGENVRPVLFRSLAQDIGIDPSFAGYSLLVRFTGPSRDIAAALRSQIHAIDPTLAIFNSQTMEEHVRDAFFLPRLAGVLFGIFGALGLTLASVGLYGLMNCWVSQRTREIGVRLALGARVGEIQRLIIGKGMLLLLIALVPGLFAALTLTKLLVAILYGVPPNDPLTFALVPVFLGSIAFVACWIPSRRAAGVEPLTALRHE